MRVRRLLVAVITAGLIAPTAAVVSTLGTPASAATPTTIVSNLTKGGWLAVQKTQKGGATYGDDVALGIGIADASGTRVSGGGTISVLQLLSGSSTWQTVATGTGTTLNDLDAFKVRGSATYRVTYSGDATYAPTEATVTVKAQRKLSTQDVEGKRAGLKGKLAPAGKVKIVIEKKVGKKYTKFRTQRTASNGRFTILLPVPQRGRFYWKITFAGSKGFKKSVVNGSTYKRF